MPEQKAKIGILGASGYTGAELVRLLLRHPPRRDRAAHRRSPRRQGNGRCVSAICAVCAADADRDRRRRLAGARARSRLLRAAARHDAEGHCRCAHAAPATKVVDLSADFRLADPAAYARWYGHAHAAPRIAKGGGVRPDRNLSAEDQGGAARRQSGLLHDLRRAGAHSAAARPRRSIPTRSSSTPNRA